MPLLYQLLEDKKKHKEIVHLLLYFGFPSHFSSYNRWWRIRRSGRLTIYSTIYILYISINLFIYTSIYRPIYFVGDSWEGGLEDLLSIYLFIYLPIYLSFYCRWWLRRMTRRLTIYLSIHSSTYLSIFLLQVMVEEEDWKTAKELISKLRESVRKLEEDLPNLFVVHNTIKWAFI